MGHHLAMYMYVYQVRCWLQELALKFLLTACTLSTGLLGNQKLAKWFGSLENLKYKLLIDIAQSVSMARSVQIWWKSGESPEGQPDFSDCMGKCRSQPWPVRSYSTWVLYNVVLEDHPSTNSCQTFLGSSFQYKPDHTCIQCTCPMVKLDGAPVDLYSRSSPVAWMMY